MQYVVTYQICTQCSGTGNQPYGSGTVPCTWPGCLDSEPHGYVETGRTALDPGLDDVLDKVNDVLDKCDDIKAAVDEL
jgi:hypothetical protein